MNTFRKILKLLGFIGAVFFIGSYSFFYWATSPKSDEKVLQKFYGQGIVPEISKLNFNNFDFRKVSIYRDSTPPTIVFVHGAIGSVLDFSEYMMDSLLLKKANMIVYDRIGYNHKDKNNVQESIAFERDMLEEVVKGLALEKTILVGYSYGGPIALASYKKYKKVILLAPAVYSKVEPMPWLLNLNKWKLTRWLIPPVWKQASREKLSHKRELEKFENKWHLNSNKIVSIHGNSDWIVPFSNSEYLNTIFPPSQLELIALDNAGHELIWSHFKQIKLELLKYLD
tara:strand:+ start:41 stop:892 length:852 start_codon:yes stop_codon:yes gene_type:complete